MKKQAHKEILNRLENNLEGNEYGPDLLATLLELHKKCYEPADPTLTDQERWNATGSRKAAFEEKSRVQRALKEWIGAL